MRPVNRDDQENHYADDYMRYMLFKESSMTQIEFVSPQLHCRPVLIHWLKRLNEQFSYCQATLFTGIRILDEYMDNFHIEKHRLRPVAIICHNIAAKYQELESSLPTFTRLLAILKTLRIECPRGWEITVQALREIEVHILKFRHVRIFYPTVLHFTDYFATRSVTDEDSDILEFGVAFTTEATKKKIDELVDLIFFESARSVTLQQKKLINCRPSCVAAACLLIARLDFGLSPTWPRHLVETTSYRKMDLLNTMNLITNILGQRNESKREHQRADHSVLAGTEPMKKFRSM